ncbi:MAG: molybdate ABC transporter substrate-binding protein [Acidimicrobiia bacterium]
MRRPTPSRRPGASRALGILLASVIALAGACGGDDGAAGAGDGGSGATSAAPTGTITVYAARSLAAAFAEIGARFEEAHTGTTVAFNVAGSSALVAQIQQGAPADVFASADEPNMERAVTAGLTSATPTVFARNRLQIAVARGNPKRIASLADLARADVLTVLCAPAVPCGNYARQALTKAGADVTSRSDEQDVAAVVGRIANGEADAGIVYVTDVLASPEVDGVEIPAAENVVAEYPFAAVRGAPNPVGASAFLAFVLSTEGRAVLAGHGFQPA